MNENEQIESVESVEQEQIQEYPLDNSEQPEQPEEQQVFNEEVTESEPSSEEPKTYRIKADGKDFDFTIDELQKLAPKAINYTRKMQQLAPFRRMVESLEKNNISEDDLNMFIDMRNGDKTAISRFLNNQNISTLDVNEVSDEDTKNYKPSNHIKPQNTFDDYVSTSGIKDHTRYNDLCDFVNGLDAKSQNWIINQPEILNNLLQDMDNGLFDNIRKISDKQKVLDNSGRSFLELYKDNAIKAYDNLAQLKKQEQENKLKADKTKLKATGTTKSQNKPSGVFQEYNEDEYNELYYQIMNRYPASKKMN